MLLSLATIPAWTIYYVYRVMRYIQIQTPPPDFIGLPPLPVPFYITGLAWLVFDVLREYNEIVEAKRRTSKEDTIEPSRD